MEKHKNTAVRSLEKAAKPSNLIPLTVGVRQAVQDTGMRATKGTKRDGDRNTITSTSNRDDDALIGEDIAATSFDPRDDTDADGLHSGMGSFNDGFDDLTDPDDTAVHRVHASHDLMAEVEADLQHIADCLMVDTLDLELPGIASVDDTELKRAFGQVDENGVLKEDTDWRKSSLKSPTGKQSLRVRYVKKTKRLHLEGSNAINAQAHNVVSSGDVTEQAYWMCRDVHKKLNLKLPIRMGHELVHGRLVKVTRIDVVLLLKVPDGMKKATFINALAIAGIRAGINSSLYVNESVYFDKNSQGEASKIYDKAAELKRARKGGLPDVEGVELLDELNEKTVRVEAVFRVKKLSQVAKKLGKPLEPATFTKEVLAQMVLDILRKHVCHGQIFRRLEYKELLAIPLPYRSTVAHWQNGMELLDMVASERVLKEQARYIWHNHKIDIIKGERPDSLNESLSLVDVLAPKQFMPVPAVIRDNPNLFHSVDMGKHRKKLAEQLAESLGEE